MAKKKLNCKTIKKANKKWVACFPEKGTKAKPKAKTVKKKAVINKPKAKPVKKKANIDASAGGRVLLGGGGNVMRLIGSYAIPKVERERRGRVVEREIDKMFNKLTGWRGAGYGRYAVVYHQIQYNPPMAILRRHEKGLEKTLEKYKKLTKDYKLITRKEYLSPKAREYGADTFRGNGIKMLEQLLRYIKEKREEIKKR